MIGINVFKTGATSEESFNALLKSAHSLDIVVRVLDLDHNYLKDISSRLEDGAVTVDTTAAVTRALDLTLFDPDRKVQMDPDTPARTSVFIADMISIVYRIGSPSGIWYNVPVFCGPVDDVGRDGPLLTIKALGKESLSTSNAWKGRTFKKGQEKRHVIMTILKDLMGETRIDLCPAKAKLPNDLKLTQEDSPWTVAKRLAASMGMQLFYDGRGVAVMRKKGARHSFTFSNQMVTTVPRLDYDLQGTINAVRVIGKKPKKGKQPVKYTAVAKRNHPLSPWRLGRSNVPRYLWLEIEDDSLKTKKECKTVATRELKRGLLAGVDVAFDGIPQPRLQEGDIVRVDTDEVDVTILASKFTIPLVAGVDSSYGYLKRTRPRGGARGVRKKDKKPVKAPSLTGVWVK